MVTTIIRTVILYVAVMVSVRLMGKRQIGQLQPGELVVTILLSEIAAIPIQDNEIPLVNSLIPLALLIGFEVLGSVIALKSPRFRSVTAGRPVVLMENGKLDEKKLKDLRLSVSDLLAALRQKDVFDPGDVACAVVETNGSLSVLKQAKTMPASAQDAGVAVKEGGLPRPVAADGQVLAVTLGGRKTDVESVNKYLRQHRLKAEDVLLLTVDDAGDWRVFPKNGGSV